MSFASRRFLIVKSIYRHSIEYRYRYTIQIFQVLLAVPWQSVRDPVAFRTRRASPACWTTGRAAVPCRSIYDLPNPTVQLHRAEIRLDADETAFSLGDCLLVGSELAASVPGHWIADRVCPIRGRCLDTIRTGRRHVAE